MFINPIKNGYLTSAYDYRWLHGKYEFHYGVDISYRPNTNVPILAAADGVVVDYWPNARSTYGEVLFISHTINGKKYTTVYAHLKMNSLKVKKGDKVKQGQPIAIMGNTDGGSGRSTAPHLHFEIHNGNYEGQKKNSLNPQKYVQLYREAELIKMKEQLKKLEEEVKDLKTLVQNVNVRDPKRKDLAPDDWAKGDIEFAKTLEYDKGKYLTDGTFLKDPITRQEVIVLIVRSIRHIKRWVESLLNLK